MNNTLDRDIIAIEQQLLNVASQIDDLLDAYMTIPEDEREDRSDITNLELLADKIRESI